MMIDYRLQKCIFLKSFAVAHSRRIEGPCFFSGTPVGYTE